MNKFVCTFSLFLWSIVKFFLLLTALVGLTLLFVNFLLWVPNLAVILLIAIVIFVVGTLVWSLYDALSDLWKTAALDCEYNRHKRHHRVWHDNEV